MAAALRLLIPAAAILTVLLIVSWRAGHEAGELEGQPLSAEITVLGQRVASAQLELNREKKRTAELENALKSSGKSSSLDQVLQLKQQLLQAQAEANQYKSITQREQRTSNDGDYLIEALSNPGARLFPMKGSEAAADSTAYALIVEKTRLMFIGSKLPKLADGRQFQLWLVRKQDPKVVSAGVFSANDDGRATVNFDDQSVLSDLALLVITEEPEGGSTEPTGAHLFEVEIEKSIDRAD